MRNVILAEPYRPRAEQWLTTRDVARMLQVTGRWVRGLASLGRLTYEQTPNGMRIFRERDVLRLIETRARGRAQSRRELLAAVRPRMLRATIEPRQARMRLVLKKRKVTSACGSESAKFVRGSG